MITLPFPRRTMIAPAPRRFLTFTMSATIAATLSVESDISSTVKAE
jgi:hypothetical protein